MTEINHDNAEVVAKVAAAFLAPFDPKDVKWKPQSVKGNRALAMAFIDARLVMDRLDEVVGIAAWHDAYEIVPDGSVVCQLSVRIGGDWLTKTDVGSPSEQPDGGDRLKAAFSDALKRAAVKFGIGRYLYRLPAQWADYDPVRRQFVQPPTLPAFAVPGKNGQAIPKATPAKANGQLPADGKELYKRLSDYEDKLVRAGRCGTGELLAYVGVAGMKAGYKSGMVDWSGPAIPFAVEAVKEFEAGLKK